MRHLYLYLYLYLSLALAAAVLLFKFQNVDTETIALTLPGAASWLLLVPPLVTAAMTLGVGVFAHLDLSPLGWAQLIAQREFTPR